MSIQDFRKRQEQDHRRFRGKDDTAFRRKPFRERHKSEESEEADDIDEGEEAWQNAEGEGLKDFGLDEQAEFYDEEDDMPLSLLLLRKRQISQQSLSR